MSDKHYLVSDPFEVSGNKYAIEKIGEIHVEYNVLMMTDSGWKTVRTIEPSEVPDEYPNAVDYGREWVKNNF